MDLFPAQFGGQVIESGAMIGARITEQAIPTSAELRLNADDGVVAVVNDQDRRSLDRLIGLTVGLLALCSGIHPQGRDLNLVRLN
jgi:hypothetical protein